MVKKDVFIRSKVILFVSVFVFVLVGCTGREPTYEETVMNEVIESPEIGRLPSVTPTPTLQILPTRTPDLIRPDTVRATYAAEATQQAMQPTNTPSPSRTPTLSPVQLCKPFPDDIQYLGSTNTLGFAAWTIQAKCQGEITYLRSPVGDMAFYDYTALTGRFAYGPLDVSEAGLWVYDYWAELSEKWFDKKIARVEWAPGKDAEGVQLLAVLDHEGTLFIASGPFQIQPISLDVSHFSFSPTGDRLAYVKQEILYVAPIDGSQARKLAEDVYGTPVWALEENVIIFPSSPIKFTNLDGSGAFFPGQAAYITKADPFSCIGENPCSSSNPIPADNLLWDGESNILVFQIVKLNEYDSIFRTLYVLELSENLQSIVSKQIIIGDFGYEIEWEIPGEILVDRSGNWIRIKSVKDVYTVRARITSVSDQYFGVEFVWLNSSDISFAHQFSKVMISDLTQITDIHGNSISPEDITKGMTIMLSARGLSQNTLSLFAYKIQIECDQMPCDFRN